MAETSLSPRSVRALREEARISLVDAGAPHELRRRFFAEARARVGRRALPTLGGLALACAVTAVSEALRPSSSIVGVAACGAAAIAAAASVALVRVARRSLPKLATVATVGATAGVLGLAALVGASGGAASPHAVVLGVAWLATLTVLSLPLPALAALAGVGFVAVAVGAHGASPGALLALAATGVLAVLLGRQRERRALRVFARTERLAASLARVRAMQDELVVVEKLEAMRVLVGGVAHELNNALAVAQVAVDAARAEPARAEVLLPKAQGGLLRIQKTVERLRRFAMASEGTLEPADVGAMLDFALDSAIGRARSGVIVERDYGKDVGAVECHVSQLAEALFQIARNAVEAMPGGGTIRARVRAEADEVILSVEDEGRGIPEEDLPRVFDPFFSRQKGADVYTTLGGSRARGGSGMGLAAVYGIVTGMGGRVKIRSAVGKGTEVAVFLPRRRGAALSR